MITCSCSNTCEVAGNDPDNPAMISNNEYHFFMIFPPILNVTNSNAATRFFIPLHERRMVFGCDKIVVESKTNILRPRWDGVLIYRAGYKKEVKSVRKHGRPFRLIFHAEFNRAHSGIFPENGIKRRFGIKTTIIGNGHDFLVIIYRIP